MTKLEIITQIAVNNALIKKTARIAAGLGMLETANSDSLDFCEVAVWNVQQALEEAYEAGRKSVAQNL